jgi:hypothetical protein
LFSQLGINARQLVCKKGALIKEFGKETAVAKQRTANQSSV